MATPKIIADFETQLATAISVGTTSFTLSSATDDDGVALPAGLYYFTVDNSSTQKEYLAGTLSGVSVTAVLSVSRQGAETSGAVRAHRIGASVILTDFATYKKYMDGIALVSAPDASTTAKGVVEAATLAEVRARTATGGTGAIIVATPDVLTDLPTVDEKAAMAGGGALGTPSTSNKFQTQTGVIAALAANPPTVQTFTASGTWTKQAGLKYIIVEGVGGGCDGSASNESGSGGGYFRKLILAASLAATETITIGSNGVPGGNTSFGAFCTGSGGNTTAGGTATGGDINISGSTGANGGSGGTGGNYGIGGSSQLGIGSNSMPSGYGAGGAASNGTTNSGSAGIVIITEYYS